MGIRTMPTNTALHKPHCTVMTAWRKHLTKLDNTKAPQLAAAAGAVAATAQLPADWLGSHSVQTA